MNPPRCIIKYFLTLFLQMQVKLHLVCYQEEGLEVEYLQHYLDPDRDEVTHTENMLALLARHDMDK